MRAHRGLSRYCILLRVRHCLMRQKRSSVLCRCRVPRAGAPRTTSGARQPASVSHPVNGTSLLAHRTGTLAEHSALGTRHMALPDRHCHIGSAARSTRRNGAAADNEAPTSTRRPTRRALVADMYNCRVNQPEPPPGAFMATEKGSYSDADLRVRYSCRRSSAPSRTVPAGWPWTTR